MKRSMNGSTVYRESSRPYSRRGARKRETMERLGKTLLIAAGGIAAGHVLRQARVIRTHESGIVLGLAVGLAAAGSTRGRRLVLSRLAQAELDIYAERLEEIAGQDLSPEADPHISQDDLGDNAIDVDARWS